MYLLYLFIETQRDIEHVIISAYLLCMNILNYVMHSPLLYSYNATEFISL